MAVWLQVKVRGRRAWTAAYRLYARLVCDKKAPLQLPYAACGSINVLYAFAFASPMCLICASLEFTIAPIDYP